MLLYFLLLFSLCTSPSFSWSMDREKEDHKVLFLSSDYRILPFSSSFIEKSQFLNCASRQPRSAQDNTALALPFIHKTAQKLKKGGLYHYSSYVQKQFDSICLGDIDTNGKTNFSYALFQLLNNALKSSDPEAEFTIFEENSAQNVGILSDSKPINVDEISSEQALQLFALTDYLGIADNFKFIFNCKGALESTWNDISTKEPEEWHPHSQEVVNEATKLITQCRSSMLDGRRFLDMNGDIVPWRYMLEIDCPPSSKESPIRILTTNMLVHVINGRKIDAIECSPKISLQYVDLRDLFNEFPDIKKIYLYNNNITQILLPPKLASNQIIYLRNNALSSLPPISLAPGSKLLLSGNPLSAWQKIKIAYAANPSLLKASRHFLKNTKLEWNYLNKGSCFFDFILKEFMYTVAIGSFFAAYVVSEHSSLTSDENAQRYEAIKYFAIFGLFNFIGGSCATVQLYSNSYGDLKKNLKNTQQFFSYSFLPYNPFEK